MTALSQGFSTQEACDIITGIQRWAGVNGITFDYVSAPPGFGVITFRAGSGLGSVEYATYSYGGTGNATNQITGGLVQFDLNYVYSDSSTSYRVYDPSAPNADSYLSSTSAHGMGHIMGLGDVKNAGTSQQTSNSAMGGSIGPNNNGLPGTHPAPTSGGPTDCDKQTVTNQATINTANSGGGSAPGDGGSGSASTGGDCSETSYEEWDDENNNITAYYEVVC